MAGRKRWRLLDTGVRSAAENMALDEVLLASRDRGESPNTLRFLQFSPPAVLVGYHQSVPQEVRLDFCRQNGIQINRRVTGGGSIYFDESQLGWELIVSRAELGLGRAMAPWFQQFCEGAILGLRKLGVEATFRPKNDVEVRGRKICGTGGTEDGEAILFQGTLLTDFDVETMLRALRIPLEKLKDKEIASLRERVTCLKEELGYLPPLERIKEALVQGFQERFGIELAPSGLTEWEEAELRAGVDRFESEEWIWGTRVPEHQEHLLTGIRKTEGGLIRVALLYNEGLRRLKDVLITGDFFAFPQRLILDLEAALRGTSEDEIESTVGRFFQKAEGEIPGVEAADFVAALEQALERRRAMDYGVPTEQVHSVHTVVEPLDQLMRKERYLILMPYCAKATWCGYRYRKDCGECGLCTVGEGYNLARVRGMEIETIVNYEDLEETLRQAKARGIEAFVGCCCEGFLVKHRADFEAIGLGGILLEIDSTSCYDLGEEDKAYRGQFERETEVRVDLLRTIVERAGKTEALAN